MLMEDRKAWKDECWCSEEMPGLGRKGMLGLGGVCVCVSVRVCVPHASIFFLKGEFCLKNMLIRQTAYCLKSFLPLRPK